jgi:ABC-type Fe3+/spermidine/putrescine transport system ATPase subunit
MSGERASVDVEALKRRISVEAGPQVQAGNPAQLLLRPEHILLNQEGEGVAAEIVEAIYLGELSQFSLLLESGRILTARQITDRSLKVGDRVKLSWKREHARVVVDSSNREEDHA